MHAHLFYFAYLLFCFQLKSVKTGSVFWATLTSLSYFYMVSICSTHRTHSTHSTYSIHCTRSAYSIHSTHNTYSTHSTHSTYSTYSTHSTHSIHGTHSTYSTARLTIITVCLFVCLFEMSSIRSRLLSNLSDTVSSIRRVPHRN